MAEMTLKTILRDCREAMDRSVEYFEKELRGIRTGRATTALVDYVKVDYYGNHSDLKDIAAVSVPEPTQIVIKPFDPTSTQAIVKAIEQADLGLNPQSDSGVIRVSVPAPSRERRQQLVAQVRKIAEDSKIAIRNERRDANKHIDTLVKDKQTTVSEDQGKDAQSEVDDLTRSHTDRIDEVTNNKVKEVETV